MSTRLTQDDIERAVYEYGKQWDSRPFPGDSQFGEYLYELKAAIAEAQRKHSDQEWIDWLRSYLEGDTIYVPLTDVYTKLKEIL